MSEQLKYIVEELNKEPFKRSYNLITFDSLQPLQVLQVLNDVFTEIDSKQKIDIREEVPENMAVRMINFLRVLKYKPTTEASVFRQGLVSGEKHVIYPILQWVLQKSPELKKRAYLARFLMKIDVPKDFLQDEQVSETSNQYEELVEQFKELHRDVEKLRNSTFSTSEIRKDIAHMEEEKEQLLKRIERLKKKSETVTGSERMLEVARNLRREKEREQKVMQQKLEQKSQLLYAEQRLNRCQQQVKDLKQSTVGSSAEGLIKRLEEEFKVNSYLCQDKLPKEIEMRKKSMQDLQRVVNEPAMSHHDLKDLQNQIQTLNTEVNSLIEKKMVLGNPIDGKVSLFKQQASIIAHKKEASAEQVTEVRDEMASIEQEFNQKKVMCKEVLVGETLSGDEFKRYINKLRTKNATYKKKRQELSEIRAEYGVLSRTEEILKNRFEAVKQQMSEVESRKGIAGFHSTQEELEKVSVLKSELDEKKGRTLTDMSDMVNLLYSKINEKKQVLAPLIKELRPLRQHTQEVSQEYENKKLAYETTLAGLEANRAKLEQDVKILREECASEEGRFHYINCMKKLIEARDEAVKTEMKAYVSSDPLEKKKALRDVYTKKIQEQENLGKALREKQKSVRESHNIELKQMKMWSDLEALMKCKVDCFERARHQATMFNENEEEDRLVLGN